MNILTLNTEAYGGGASQIALSLMDFYRTAGHDSWMLNAVHNDTKGQTRVLQNDDARNPLFRLTKRLMEVSLQKRIPFIPKLLRLTLSASEPNRTVKLRAGREDFYQPATRGIPEQLNPRPNVIHAHNLFGNYFDLRELPRISRQLPFVLTLHDMWTFTGHCSHPLDCERWLQACGQCPYLELPPAVPRDSTAANLALKNKIYKSSVVHVVTPSRWLMEQMEKSILRQGSASTKVIPNGVDQNIFKPGDQATARKYLGLPKDAKVLLFVAAGSRSNPWKDYETLDNAVKILASKKQDTKLILLAPGSKNAGNHYHGVEVHPMPWISNRSDLAHYYHAADLYLHAAHAENFPNVILEALSCGLPVIGTRTGGIPEQIDEDRTGHVVPKGDAQAMAEKAHLLLNSPEKRQNFSDEAARTAKGAYSCKRMGRDYLAWFDELLEAA